MKTERDPIQADENPILHEPARFAAMDMRERMRYLRKRTLEHLWGPTGSVLLHLVVIALVLRYFTRILPPPKIVSGEVTILEVKPQPVNPVPPEPPRPEEPDVMPPPTIGAPTVKPPDVDRIAGEALPDHRNFSIITEVPGVLILPGLEAFGRTPEGREILLTRNNPGLREVTEPVVKRALDWLAEHQVEDGSWAGSSTASSKTAMTGMALLTFLAHGETHRSPKYGRTVEKAIRFLIEQDLRDDGTFRNVDSAYYGHGIAAYALSEAFMLTRIPAIKPAMERAVARIVSGQQPSGSFNYRLNPGDTRRDTSVSGWMAQALKAAYIARADVPGLKEALDRTIEGFKANFDAGSHLYAYAPGGGQDAQGAGETTGRPSTTPIAVLALQLLGHQDDVETQAGLKTLKTWTADWNQDHPSSWPLYTWYYATQAIFNGGGDVWTKWNNTFAGMLVRNQNADGSWSPTGRSEAAFGPVYGTSFSALSLMVYYRGLMTQPIPNEDPQQPAPVSGVDVTLL